MNDQGPQLIKFDAAMRALTEATDIDEVKEIRDQAEAIRAYTKQRGGSLQIQNQAAAIKLRAERRLGELLADQPMNPGGEHMHLSNDSTGAPPTLAEQGITRDQSSVWQAIAEMPEPEFEAYIAKAEVEGEELTTTGLVKEIRRHRVKDTRAAVDAAEALVAQDPEEKVALARLKAQYSRVVSKISGDLLPLRAAAVAGLLGDYEWRRSYELQRLVNEWFDDLHAAKGEAE